MQLQILIENFRIAFSLLSSQYKVEITVRNLIDVVVRDMGQLSRLGKSENLSNFPPVSLIHVEIMEMLILSVVKLLP